MRQRKFTEGMVDIEEKKYPSLLKKIPDAPGQLYFKGNWSPEIFENCLAVVGSRRMTLYGKQVVGKLAKETAASGITIVSGFMFGVDAEAHRAALDGGGRTIAVMPCGINIIHPAYQKDLYYEILEKGGLVISEFEPDFPPANWTYPKRNRIVAGLSKAALIVEAGEKSGSLITAGLALKYKRKLFAVPGPITSKVSEGTNRLLKNEASPALNSQDIMDFYGIKKSAAREIFQKEQTSQIEGRILEILKREPMEIDKLSRIFGLSSARLGVTLSLMAIKGLICLERGKYFINQN
jgi:DNA processing protein